MLGRNKKEKKKKDPSRTNSQKGKIEIKKKIEAKSQKIYRQRKKMDKQNTFGFIKQKSLHIH